MKTKPYPLRLEADYREKLETKSEKNPKNQFNTIAYEIREAIKKHLKLK